MPSKVFGGGAAAMAAVLVISNYLVQFPLGDWLTWAAFTYPIAFLITDCVNRAAGTGVAAKVAAFGFAFGVPLSFLFITTAGGDWFVGARIATASGLAFISAQAADIAIFSRIRDSRDSRKSQNSAWWLPPAVSSSAASVVDTFAFFFIAFAGSGVPWLKLAAGDLAIKMLMVLLLLPLYRLFISSRLATATQGGSTA